MKSFIFNNFKQRLLTGNIKGQDTWTFKFVNKRFVDDWENTMKSFETERMFKYKDMRPNDPIYNYDILNKYWCNCLPVYYIYKKAVNTDEAEKPTFVDVHNWDEFIKRYPKNKHLWKLFFTEGGKFARTYESEDVDENGNPIIEYRGFYFVRTSEELRWCADKVNGNIGEIKHTKIYNNEINIVLGDNIGTENPMSLDDNKIINYCIGESIDKPFNGIFFGNGFIFKNLRILCQGIYNGIFGVLGPTGLVSHIRFEGKNLLVCKKEMSITHLENDGTDINAGLICGLNKGLIINNYVRGNVYIKGFIPKVYSVQNRTDTGNAFDCPDSNKYYPSYLCINNIANIIPYVGYFAEGVFCSLASDGDIPWTSYAAATGGKAYWKSNGVSWGAVGHYDGIKEVNNYYPYDNSSCSEWAYPSIDEETGTTANLPITGHVLYYDINSMIWTQSELNIPQGDWAEHLSMVVRRDKTFSNGNFGPYKYEIGANQFSDKSIKMHPFNRMAYCVGIAAGNNNGRIFNFRANVNTVFNGTFVGFFGGLAGKWNARNHIWSYETPEICDVAINMELRDQHNRKWWESDSGDVFKTDNNHTNFNFYSLSFYAPRNNTYPTLENAATLTKWESMDAFGHELSNVEHYSAPTGPGGWKWETFTNVRSDGFDFNNNPVITVQIHDVNLTEQTVKMKSFSVDTSKKTDARKAGIYASYDTMLTYKTGDESAEVEVSAINVSGALYCTGNVRPSIPADLSDAIGIMWKDRTDKATSNYFYGREADNEVQVVHGNTFTSNEAAGTFIVSDVEFKIESLIKINTNPQQFGDRPWLLRWQWDKCESLPFGVVRLMGKNATDPVLGYIVSVKIGELEVRPDNTINVPDINIDHKDDIFGKLYNYTTYSIVESRNVTFTVYSVEGTDKVYKFTIPKLSSAKLNASSKARTPVISWMNSARYIDGCKNYHIKERSIKNIGGVFGSVVLGAGDTPVNIWNVSAYMKNKDTIMFKKTANMRCNKFQQEVDVNWFSAANGFSADTNFSSYSADQVYFTVTGEGEGHPCLLKYTNNKCGATEDFLILSGMEIASYNGMLMYKYDNYTFPTSDYDYYFANRFGGFAAVCEINSSNISDKDWLDYNNNAQYSSKYINFINTNFIYDETSYTEKFDGPFNSVFGEGPMQLQYQETYACPFGVALPFIAEIKPICQSIPTIIECPLSNLPAVTDSSYVDDDDVNKFEWKYKRIGLYNNDVNLASPSQDPNFWSTNLIVDLPGVKNRIKLNHMEINNVSACDTWTVNYDSFTDPLIDKLFYWKDLRIGACNMGAKNAGKGPGSPGFGWNTGIYSTFPSSWLPRWGRQAATPADDPDEVCYSDSKILAAWQTHGSDIVLIQKPYSGHGPCDAYNIAITTHPTALGEFQNSFGYMVSQKSVATIENKPFNVEKGLYENVMLWHEYGIKGNMKQADVADTFTGIDTFKYNYRKRIDTDNIFNSFTKSVEMNEVNGQYGFYFKDDVKDVVYPTNPALSGYKYYTHTCDQYGNQNYLYDSEGNLMKDEYGKPIPDGFDYDGRVLHVGLQLSELCIMNNLKEYNTVVGSGISADSEFEGMLVIDSEQRPVMYIDVGLGECDGSQSWARPCSGRPGESGLLLEIK